MKKKTKILSLMLTLAFMVMLWPGAALAEDETPPEWADVPLAAEDRHPGCKRVSFIPYPKDKTVTAYYVIVNHGDTAPTKEQVRDGSDYGDVVVLASGSQNDVKTNGYVINPYTELPADDTIYDTYVVIEDTAGNISEPAMIELRTPVKLLADGYPKVGTPQAAGSKQVQILNQANGDSETTYGGGLADAYYVAVANGANAPSAAQIKKGFDSTGSDALASGNVPIATANTEVPAVITLPADAAEYDVYVVLHKAYNASYVVDIWSEVVQLDVTTPLPALAAPTGLAWDDTTPGAIMAKWDAVPNALKYKVYLYKEGHIYLETLENTNERNFISNLENYGSGTYTFKVTAIGDGTNYGDSQMSAASLGYNYTAAPDKIDIPAISGVTAPVKGVKPVTSIETDQYTGAVSWAPAIIDNEFATETIYTATITLTPKAGYTLTGVSADFFTVEGATSVTNAADSGEVTAVFPATEAAEAAEVYAFDVLVDSDVTKVYSIWEESHAYPVCNGLLVYVEEGDTTQAVEISFIPGANDGGVYDVTLDVAFPGNDGSYLEFLFSELPTVPSEISLTTGDAFTLDEVYYDQYSSESTGEGDTYSSLYQGFEFEGLEPGGQLNATFTATLPRSDGDPVVRTINLTVRHNPELFPDLVADFNKLLGDRDDLYPADIWQGMMFSDDNDWLTSDQVLSGTVNDYRAFAVKADSYVDVALAFEASEYDKVILWDLYDSTGELFDDDDYYEIVNELIGESEVKGYRSYRTPEGIYTSSEAGPWLLVATNIRGDYLPIVLSLTDVEDEENLVLPQWQAAWDDIIAEYEDTYTVTISGGGSGASGAGGYAVGDTVNINAGSRSGYTFKGWTSDDVTITNASSKNASFTMPANDVIVTASWKRASSGGGGGGVVTPTVTGVKIETAPDKVSYTEGDELDLTGLKVTLTYSNGTTKDIALADFADYKITVSPKAGDVLDADDKEIVITVNGKIVKQAITVAKKETVTPPVEPVLTDISGHWAKDSIEHLVEMGAISGYPDNTFRPDNLITRAEFATVLVKAMGLPTTGSKVFADTKGHWAKESISTAYAAGIISGYNEQSFGPDDPITREQMAVMVVKAAGLTGAAPELKYADSQQISAWAREFVARAAAEKLISGYPDNTFRPANNATRAEAVTVISQKW